MTLSYQVEKRIENNLNIKGENHDKRRYHHHRSCNTSLCLYSININQELQMKNRAPLWGVFCLHIAKANAELPQQSITALCQTALLRRFPPKKRL